MIKKKTQEKKPGLNEMNRKELSKLFVFTYENCKRKLRI